MSTKLVRKQLLLDEQVLKELEALNNQRTHFSLSKYLRDLIKQDVENHKQIKHNKKQKLLEKAGFLETDGRGNEAINHNDIYDI